MKLAHAIQLLGPTQSMQTAELLAETIGLDWRSGVGYVFSVVAKDPNRAPNNIVGKTEVLTINAWMKRYKRGYDSRTSQRKSNSPGTIADPMIEKIIGARIGNLDNHNLLKITQAHRLAMAAENILGLLLEEYLAINLKEYSWHCAWGETVRSVDFVNEQGKLLQIKNRSNSENSSSSAIRTDTTIGKWYRIKADRIEYRWDQLNNICDIHHLSEEDFVNFATNCIRENPDCLAIELDNEWQRPEF